MKTFCCTLLLTVLVSSGAFAQTRTTETRTTKDSTKDGVTTTVTTTISETEDITPRNNILSVSPLRYILFYNLTYLRKFAENWVLGIGLSLPTFGGKLDDQTTVGGFGANFEARYYPNGNAPRGFYFAPNVYYNTISITDGSDLKVLWTTIGLMLGYQFFPMRDFSLGCGVGFDYFLPSATDSGESVSNTDQFQRMVPAIRFDIGYAWK